MTLSENAIEVLKRRYFIKDKDGKCIEDWEGLCHRVSDAIAKDEPVKSRKKWAKKYFDLMYNLKFLPNSPALMNAGKDDAQMMACFCLPIEDSMDKIMDTAKDMAMIHKAAGGTGFNFGKLRPKNSIVNSTSGVASGPISFMKMLNDICEQVKSGGRRRGANIGLLPVHHPDILDFINCKQDTSQITNFNISILVTDIFMRAVIEDKEYNIINPQTGVVEKKLKAKMVFNKIVDNAHATGEPGLFFVDTVNKTNEYPEDPISNCNPCLVGDTKIAVADGRGSVSIKQLADSGDDVPVYCSDNNGRTVIKWMRNPRLTGYNEKIYKVILDNGNMIRCTGNHRFVLKNGNIKEAKTLKRNDSLNILNRVCAPFEYIFNGSNSSSNNYWWIQRTNKSFKAEHRLVHEFINDVNIPSGYVIHHKDFNSLNNNIDNLELMRRQDHDNYHGSKMFGDNNPMRRAKTEWSKEKWDRYHNIMSVAISAEKNGRYSGVSNEEIKQYAILLTTQLNRRASTNEWEEYCEKNKIHVKYFSKWRKNNLFGGVSQLLKWAAIECDVEYVDIDPRVVKTYQKALGFGFDAFIENGKTFVIKKCEFCGTEFSIDYQRREIGVCSTSCSNKLYYKLHGNNNDRTNAVRATYNKKNEETREKQILAYNDLKNNLLRDPFLIEFKDYCKKIKTSHRFGRVFKTFQELKDVAQLANHRVISVEFDGYEDVYNGTVDDYHNIYIGGFVDILDEEYFVESYVLTLQCGESPLRNYESCDLGSINLSKYYDVKVDWDNLEKDIRIATRFLDSIISQNHYPLDIIKKETEKTRKIGLGIMGFADLLYKMKIKYGSEESFKFAEKIMKFIQDISVSESEKLGVEKGMCPVFDSRRNIWTTIIAPTGTISIIAGASSGCEPVFSLAYMRMCMDDTKMTVINEIFLEVLKEKGIELTDPLKEKLFTSNSIKDIKEIPDEIKDIFVTTSDITPEEHVKIQSSFQKYVHGGISKTCNMAKSATKKDVGDAFLSAYNLGCKGITVYRDGSRPNQVLSSTVENKDNKEESKIRYRSRVLTGTTEKFETPLGNMYLTINKNKPDEEPIEVMINIGKSGGITLSFMEALGRLISTGLKYKIPLMRLAKCLKGIKTTENSSFDGHRKMRYDSIPDLIGKELERLSKEKIKEEKFFNECPECGDILRKEEGCIKCHCGYSKC